MQYIYVKLSIFLFFFLSFLSYSPFFPLRTFKVFLIYETQKFLWCWFKSAAQGLVWNLGAISGPAGCTQSDMCDKYISEGAVNLGREEVENVGDVARKPSAIFIAADARKKKKKKTINRKNWRRYNKGYWVVSNSQNTLIYRLFLWVDIFVVVIKWLFLCFFISKMLFWAFNCFKHKQLPRIMFLIRTLTRYEVR